MLFNLNNVVSLGIEPCDVNTKLYQTIRRFVIEVFVTGFHTRRVNASERASNLICEHYNGMNKI